jgi:hypothetical protein
MKDLILKNNQDKEVALTAKDLESIAEEIEIVIKETGNYSIPHFIQNYSLSCHIPKFEVKKISDYLIENGLIRWKIFSNNFASLKD